MKKLSKTLVLSLCLITMVSACSKSGEKTIEHSTSPTETAVIKATPAGAPEAALFKLEVAAGIGGSVYIEGSEKTASSMRSNSTNLAAGDLVRLSAAPGEGYVFSHWEFSGGSFDNRFTSSAVFTMPATDAHTFAYFRKTEPEVKPLPAFASASPLDAVSGYMETWRNEGLLSLKTYEVAIDEEGTKKLISRFTGSDYALRSNWSDEYIKENLLCVAVHYSAKYDHKKTFYPDGELIRSIYLSRDTKSGLWTIWGNDGGVEISAYLNGHMPWPECLKIHKELDQ